MTFVITVQLDTDQLKPKVDNTNGLDESQISLAWNAQETIPVKATHEQASAEESETVETVAIADQFSQEYGIVTPEAPSDESLIDAFMHRISDPSADADFTFLRS